jgi:fermentation-respiration switch protein FrsA (DUF1100 family)
MALQNVLIALVSISFGLSIFAVLQFQKSLNRSRKRFLNRSDDLKNADYAIFRENGDWLDAHTTQLLKLDALDNTPLSAIYVAHPNPACGVLLIHGYSSTARGMASYARYYFEHHQASVLLVDCRAHGLSGGDKIGFGYVDRLDLPLWVYQFKMHLPTQLPMIVHGVSMGASTVLYALKDGLNVDAVISDSAFIDLVPVFKRQINLLYKLPSFGLIQLISLLMRLNNGFFLREAQLLPLSAQVPLLILHGELDRFVPVEMAYTLYRAYGGPKTLYVAPNALHAMTYAVDRTRYEVTIERFLSSLHIKTSA